jgi:DNA-binding transcriptional regulator YhcF (GntR family)
MFPRLKVDPHSDTPIYKQMVAAIVAAIEGCEIQVGDKLPSIRELSAKLKINPNTTAKVYRELELRGFLESRAGAGCFVRQMDEKAAAAEKQERMRLLLDKVLGEARAQRIDEQDFIRFLKMGKS